MGVYIFPKVRLPFLIISYVNLLWLVALHFCEYSVIFFLQSPSNPSELLFDAGNWNSVDEPQTTGVILGACILQN